MERRQVEAGHSVAPSGYKPQLDGLRAIASLAVLYNHFVSEDSLLGHAGVQLFFVLSGYLITLILLAGGDRAAAGRPVHSLWHFYARRGLRLWPAYYLALAVAVLFNFDGIRSSLPWHAFYATNLYFAVSNQWAPPVIVSWWSLAVEEQFYLIWPAVLLSTPRRFQPFAALAFLGVSMAARSLYPLDSVAFWTMPFASFPALAIGAMLAMMERNERTFRWLPILIPMAIGLQWRGFGLSAGWNTQIFELMGSLAFAGFVALASRSYRGPLNWALANPIVLYLGKISYGIYLYHTLVRTVIEREAWRVAPALLYPGWPKFIVGTAATVAIASLSWFLLEQPMNRMKRRFPYP